MYDGAGVKGRKKPLFFGKQPNFFLLFLENGEKINFYFAVVGKQWEKS